MPSSTDFISLRPEALTGRERYDLLTSVVVPRPIGWISTRSLTGIPNLAPYSFFNAFSANPPLLGVSIGSRGGEPKDTLRNVRDTGAFCVNVCSVEQLEAMNLSSGEYPASVDEFTVANLTALDGEVVGAPWVGEAPVALECEVFKEVELGSSRNVLVIGEVKAVHISRELELYPGSWAPRPRSLRPVGRLGKDRYFLPGEIRELLRP